VRYELRQEELVGVEQAIQHSIYVLRDCDLKLKLGLHLEHRQDRYR
jgi:hypothetical protein